MVRFIKGFTLYSNYFSTRTHGAIWDLGPIFLKADSDRTGNLGSDWLLP